jgi:hypothetical protein
MMTLLWAVSALASDWVLPETAELPEEGQWVVALPTAPSTAGISERWALTATPFEMRVGGPRLGVEHAIPVGSWQLSVAPSLGVKVQGTQGLADLSLIAGKAWSKGRIDLSLRPSLRMDRQRALGPSDVDSSFQQARPHVPVGVAYTHLWARHAVRVGGELMLWDEGQALSMAWGGVDWSRRWSHLQLSVGVHGMVGTPSEQLFLGSYLHPIVAAYPKVGLWWVG